MSKKLSSPSLSLLRTYATGRCGTRLRISQRSIRRSDSPHDLAKCSTNSKVSFTNSLFGHTLAPAESAGQLIFAIRDNTDLPTGANLPLRAEEGEAISVFAQVRKYSASFLCYNFDNVHRYALASGGAKLIRECGPADFEVMLELINRAAQAYKGIIPPDRWKEPYMPAEELGAEIKSGVVFYGLEEDGRLLGVMGIQELDEITLIRHAYVLPEKQNQGIGGKLLEHLKSLAKARRILVGTWRAADWAIRFYQKRGFHLLNPEESKRLLQKYWSIPERQIETSVVLELKRSL